MPVVRNILVAVTILVGILASCAPMERAPRTWPGQSKLVTPTLEGCAAAGGTIQTSGGMLPGQMCKVRTPDAGKTCTDNDQCAGRCLYWDKTPGVHGREGARVTGQCEPSNGTFGCFAEVRNGRLTGYLCVD
ncbi:MAG: hypothetical protein EBR82_11095 [Caulobacteraceae bacterium]|nr:hypothetical protein [Caulobacteraceae bacterium]